MNDMKSLELASKVGDHPQKHPSRIKSMYRFVYIYIYIHVYQNPASIHTIHNFDFRSLKLPFQQLLFPQFRGGWPPGHIQQNLENNCPLPSTKIASGVPFPSFETWIFPGLQARMSGSSQKLSPSKRSHTSVPRTFEENFMLDPEGFFP